MPYIRQKNNNQDLPKELTKLDNIEATDSFQKWEESMKRILTRKEIEKAKSYEKIPHVIECQRNANKDNDEITTPVRIRKDSNNKCWERLWEQRIPPSCIAGGNVN